MKNLLLMEDFERSSLLRSDLSLNIVALTPMVMESLNYYGYKYSIPGDYYVWREDKEYTRKFQQWLINLEHFLIDCYPTLLFSVDANITTHYIFMLKNIMDAFVRKGKQFQAILNKENPDKVYYQVNSGKVDVLDDQLWFDGKSLFNRFAETLGEMVSFIYVYPNKKQKSVTNWRDNFYIRTSYDFFRYCSFVPSWKGKRKYLFASAMPGVRTFKLKGLWCEVAADYDIGDYRMDHIIPDSIVEELSSITGIDVIVTDALLRKRLNHFVNVIVPKILGYKLKWEGYLFKNNISAVVFTRRNKLYQYGLLLAARALNIPTVYVKHGWQAYDNWCNDWSRLKVFDYFVTHIESDRLFFSKRVKENNWKCEVL